jgi:hypothetical protein
MYPFPDMIDTYSMRMLDGHSTMDVSYRKLFLLSIKYFYLYSVALMKMLRDPETEQERKSSTYILFNWK